jgi:hypothetical protein
VVEYLTCETVWRRNRVRSVGPYGVELVPVFITAHSGTFAAAIA